MPKIFPLRLLQRLAGLALALAVVACSSTPTQTPPNGVTWAAAAPVIPLNTQPYPWHLMPSPQPAPATVAPAWPPAAPPERPALPMAVTAPPLPAIEVPATVPLPVASPPAAPPTVRPRVNTTGTRHTHTHTYTHTHPRKAKKAKATTPSRAARPSSTMRSTAPQRAARTNTPRAPKGPLDCATLLSTNPYLAKLLGCAPGAPNVRAPGAGASKGTASQ